MKLIIHSVGDVAGSNIARIIVERHGFTESGEKYGGRPVYGRGDVLLMSTDDSVLYLKDLPYNPEVCVVASRHRSESGNATLTCHPTGNFGEAQMGGSEGVLQLTDALYLRQCLLLLQRKKAEMNLPYEVSLEVTHHGPSGLPFPLLFVEVGGSVEHWSDMDACGAVADAISFLMLEEVEDKQSAIGFGGPHYAPNFSSLSGEYALGHIMPKYSAEHLTREMVGEMVEKTQPRPEVAVVDWKGLKGGEKAKLGGIADELSLKIVRTSELK
ncbi:MAG: D-aminoacyl-tRNA deacylase [Candidatus Altiarchaeota archaeon]